MALSTGQIDALRLLGYFFLTQGLHAKAVTIFAALDRLSPNTPTLLRALAVARDRQGEPAKALEALDRLAMMGSIDSAFHMLRAKLLGDLDRWQEAQQAMAAAIKSRIPAQSSSAEQALS